MNEADKYRQDFFDKLIREEKKKEKELILLQKKCEHNYNIKGCISDTGYQHRTCSNCGHSAIKSIHVWNRVHKKCIII